ncbi:MAG: glycosyltransferase family 2 protein [Deltaproteobacteria bacterium]|nr:glycosyltransferase family 2 protein [Deltaproteobacteria bacterium]
MARVLIIIPAYNEESTVADVVKAVKEHSPASDVVVVNDGSADGTAREARSAGAVVLNHTFNMGIGATVQTGFRYALKNGYDIAVQVDGDGQHPPEHIKDIVKPVIEGRADLVVGSRFLGVGDYKPSVARGAGIAIFSKVVSFIVGVKMTDTTSGFRASGKRVIEYLAGNYPDDYPEVEALVLLHKKGFAIMETAVGMEERKGGQSSITPVSSVYYMFKVMLAICVDLIKKVK